jgi:Zn-dependent protease
MRNGFRLGRLAGIAVHVDWSLAIVFWLITSSLALGLLPSWHPDWSALQDWATALAAALLFFASVLAHELSHAVVGRRSGQAVERITLFVFGGIAQMGGEPRNWRAELKMTIVGPATSLLIGIVSLALALGMAGSTPRDAEDIERWVAQLSPAATLLLWLGQINVILAIFNMVPGFPLDGGRVLRAVLWGVTGNLRQATRWASAGGQLFAWLLIGSGIAMIFGAELPIFGHGTISGLWLAFIGWFLNNAALMSYRQIVLQETLQHVPVGRLMETDVRGVPRDLTVLELVEKHLLPSAQRAFAVLDGRLIGMVCLRDVQKIPRAEWGRTPVSAIMTPVERLAVTGPRDDAFEALATLGRAGVNQLPVVEDGELRGLLRREDVVKWLALYGEQPIASVARSVGDG